MRFSIKGRGLRALFSITNDLPLKSVCCRSWFQVWWTFVQSSQDDLDQAKLCVDDVQVRSWFWNSWSCFMINDHWSWVINHKSHVSGQGMEQSMDRRACSRWSSPTLLWPSFWTNVLAKREVEASWAGCSGTLPGRWKCRIWIGRTRCRGVVLNGETSRLASKADCLKSMWRMWSLLRMWLSWRASWRRLTAKGVKARWFLKNINSISNCLALLGEKNGGGASVRTSLGERLYASVLQRQVGRAETPGERNVIKE